MKRLATAGLTLALLAPLAPSAEAHPGPACMGHRATITGPNTQLRAQGHRRVIVGTPHRDVIVGSGRGDWIVGAGGPDVICGGGGSDYLLVGDANRTVDRPTKLNGGPGNDYITGSFAGDLIYGGTGRDKIDGEFGADRITGGRGNDFIRAENGNDLIFGGEGDDHVEASSGNDRVYGGSGADHIATGPGEDVVFGGTGPDSIYLIWQNDRGYGGGGNDALGGGPGEDLCSGGPGADTAWACEHRRSVEGAPLALSAAKPDAHRHHHARRHRLHQDDGLGPFNREPAVGEIVRFLHTLQRTRTIQTTSETTREMDRKRVLGQAVERVVELRYAERLLYTHRVEGVFKKSVERHRLQTILQALSDEIDRLRWTPFHHG
jgi:Ca2+-binding RTX toxin-like protein